MAAAIGHAINIPIVLRALASDLHRWVPGTVLTFDPEFLRSLDSGTDHNDPTKIAKSYHQQWWSARSSPSAMVLLNAQNIAQFLDHHHKVTNMDDTVPDLLLKPAYTWSRGVTFGSVPPEIDCDRCRLYRAVSIGALDDLRDLRHYVHGLEVSYAANSGATSRRAADLYQLYEAAILKDDSEAVRTGSKMPKRNPTVAGDELRATAQAELSRLGTLPSLKWTWGLPLSSQDVLNTLKPHRHGGKFHSGYVKSLLSGLWGEDSIAPDFAFPNVADRYSSANKSVISMPELSPDQYPVHFEFPPLREFQPGSPQLVTSSASSKSNASVRFHIPDAPPLVSSSSQPVPDDDLSSSVSSDEVGPLDVLSEWDRSLAAVIDPIPVISELSRSPIGSPQPSSDHSSGSESSSADSSPDAGPEDAFSSSDSDSDSDSMYEVTATEAAAALADSELDIGVGGMVLAALIGGQLGGETVPTQSATTPNAVIALADSELDIGVGGMVLAALVGGQLAGETEPTPSATTPNPVIQGPFTADWFEAFNLDSLCESSDDSV